MGKVRYCSTSTGDRPGALVSTETCVLVTSGTASIDSLADGDRAPPAAPRPRRPAPCRAGAPRRRRSIPGSSQELALQQERAVGGDDLARGEPGADLDQIAARRRRARPRAARNAPRPALGDEDHGRPSTRSTALRGTASTSGAPRWPSPTMRAVTSWPSDSCTCAVLELEAHLRRARRLVDHRHDVGDAPAERPRPGRRRCAPRPPGRRARAPDPSRTDPG